MRRIGSLMGMLLLLAAPALAQSGNAPRKVDEGNRKYLDGDLDGALAAYTEAQVDIPDSPVLHYNIGNVLYRQGDYDRAVEEYRRAELAEDPELQAQARFNIGNSHFMSQDFAKAVEDYVQVLQRFPEDADAKRNLELALQAMQQQPPQEQQKQDSKSGSDDQPPPEQQQQQQSQQSEQQDSQSDQQDQGKQQPQKPEDSQEPKGGQQPQDKDGQQAQGNPQPSEQNLPKEEAARILDALKQQEKENMKKALMAPRTGRGTGKDW